MDVPGQPIRGGGSALNFWLRGRIMGFVTPVRPGWPPSRSVHR